MQSVCFTLLVAAIILLEILVGGTRLVFSLPGYGLLALAALLSPALNRNARETGTPSGLCWLTGLLFVGYIIGRAFFVDVPYLARSDLYLALATLIVYILVARCFVVPQIRWKVVIALMSLALVHIIWGMLQYFRGDEMALFDFLQPAGHGWQVSELLKSSNHLAGFLEFIAVMSWSLVFWSRHRIWLKMVAGYTGAAAIVAIVITGSRSGHVSLIVGLCVFAALSLIALRRASNEKFNLALCGIILLSVMAIVVVTGYASREVVVEYRAADEDGSTQNRWSLWEGAWHQFRESPVIGTGAGTYLYYGRQFRGPEVQDESGHVHNDYLEFLGEYGSVGGLLFLLMIGGHIWSGGNAMFSFLGTRRNRLRRIQSDALGLNIGGLSALAAMATHSMIDFNMHIPANALIAAFTLGMLANPGVRVSSSKMNAVFVSGLMRWTAPVAGVCLLIFALPTLPTEFHAENARTAYQDRRFSEAIDHAQKGRAMDSGNPFVCLYLGQSYTELAYIAKAEETGDAEAAWQNAAEAFEHGLEIYPMDKWLFLGMAESLDELGRPDEAQTYYQKAVLWDPNSASVRYLYARHLHKAGRLDEADQEYNASLRLHPNEDARLGLNQLNSDRQSRTEP